MGILALPDSQVLIFLTFVGWVVEARDTESGFVLDNEVVVWTNLPKGGPQAFRVAYISEEVGYADRVTSEKWYCDYVLVQG